MNGRFHDILVVDDDPSIRALVRVALELEGKRVTEAGSLEAARIALGGPVDGVVLDRQLPDGDGLQLLPDVAFRHPGARVIVSSSSQASDEPAALLRVPKGDPMALAAAFTNPGDPMPAADLLRIESAELSRAWAEVCLRNPRLPAGTEPPVADQLLEAVARALDVPQGLEIETEPHLHDAAAAFAYAVGNPTVAVEQLVCLREVLARRLGERFGEHLDHEAMLEVFIRLNLVVDRVITSASAASDDAMRAVASRDPDTGLRGRRSFEADLAELTARAVRGRTAFAVLVVDLIGMRAINEEQGRTAGDANLSAMAAVLRSVIGGEMLYRIGGDEFGVLIDPGDRPVAEGVVHRIAELAPPFRFGIAACPGEGADPDTVLAAADTELVSRRMGDAVSSRRRAAARARYHKD